MEKKNEWENISSEELSAIREAKIRNWRMWGSWFSWGSPVGLGLFFIAIGILVVLLRLHF